MTDLHIHPQAWTSDGQSLMIGARLEHTCGGRDLWFRVPVDHSESVTRWADPFVLASLHLAMKLNVPMRVHGRVSPSLLRNLEDFQQAWSVFRPESYAPVEITGEIEEEESVPEDRGAVAAFSGGVDSSFTVYRHATGSSVARARPLTAAVMVHGFDIPVASEGAFARALDRAEEQVRSIGRGLIPVATNLRELDLLWSDVFGAAIAAVLTLFRGRFKEGLVPQGVSFHCHDHLVEGSNAMTDHLLSSDTFRIVPDGAGFRRCDKVNVLAGWPECMRLLRVCLGDRGRDRNCCRCEKCIRTILTFRALGLGLPECFDEDVSDSLIRGLGRLQEMTMRIGYDDVLRLAAERGVTEPWVKTLRRRVRRNRWRQQSTIGYYGRRLRLKTASLIGRVRGGV